MIVSGSLAPVTLDQDPAAVALFPMMSLPGGSRMRWVRPVAVNPHVAVAVPAVISVNPHPSLMRWMIVDLDDRRRGRHTNDYLRH